MIKNQKYFVCGITLLFLALIILPSANAELRNINTSNFVKLENKETFEEFTLYRIGPEGEVSEITINLKVDKATDKDLIIAEKCRELFENDIELKKFVKSNSQFLDWEIKAKGNGLHWCLLLRVPFLNRSVLWRSIVRYRFLGEEDYTMVKLLGEWTTWAIGPHAARVLGFRGYVYFSPRWLFGLTILHGHYIQFMTF